MTPDRGGWYCRSNPKFEVTVADHFFCQSFCCADPSSTSIVTELSCVTGIFHIPTDLTAGDRRAPSAVNWTRRTSVFTIRSVHHNCWLMWYMVPLERIGIGLASDHNCKIVCMIGI